MLKRWTISKWEEGAVINITCGATLAGRYKFSVQIPRHRRVEK